MKATHLKCPACGSTDLEKLQWNEYRCSHCGSMLKLDSEGKRLELTGLVCLQCSSNNPVGQRFCGKCGAKLIRACPKCKVENPFDMQFCGSCGFDYTLRAEWEELQRELALLQKELNREAGKGFRWNRKRETELRLRMSELEKIGATPASLREWAKKREEEKDLNCDKGKQAVGWSRRLAVLARRVKRGAGQDGTRTGGQTHNLRSDGA